MKKTKDENVQQRSKSRGKKVTYGFNFGRYWFTKNESGNTFLMDKKNQLDVTFCILYFSSNSCSTCFGQPCAHHQELTTA